LEKSGIFMVWTAAEHGAIFTGRMDNGAASVMMVALVPPPLFFFEATMAINHDE
jgi:hypothetical protein